METDPTKKNEAFSKSLTSRKNLNFRKMEISTKQLPVKTGEWAITLLVTSIPIVGFIMLFVWAFGSNKNESKANWAKAALIWLAIIIVIYILIALIFGAALISAFN